MILHSRADSEYVRIVLIPLLRACGLHVVTLADSLEPGVEELVGVERSLANARRVMAVVGAAFDDEEDGYGPLELHALAQRKAADVRAGRFSIIPAFVEEPRALKDRLPEWLMGLVGVKLEGSELATGMARLVRVLRAPMVPER